LVEQLAAVDLSRLGDHVGKVSAEELTTLDDALRDVLSL
jgi:mRNA-degrading endonuclease toxin of MazEF toxin-antitoxin module